MTKTLISSFRWCGLCPWRNLQATSQKMHEDSGYFHTVTVLCVRVCNTHCDIVITAEPHSMKKNIMKWIKCGNYLQLFLYSNISFMLSQYERSSHSLIRFKHWHNVFDYVMFPIIARYQFDTFIARWLSINSIILLTSSLHFKRVPATHCHTRAHNHSSNTTAN